jgi:hypothetical protein
MLGLTAVPEEDYGRFRFHADRYVKGDTWTKFLDAFRDGDVLQYIQEKLWQTAWEKAPATADLVTKVLLSESPDDKIIIFTERVKCAEEIVRLIEKKEPGAALLHHGSLGDDKRSSNIFMSQDATTGFWYRLASRSQRGSIYNVLTERSSTTCLGVQQI